MRPTPQSRYHTIVCLLVLFVLVACCFLQQHELDNLRGNLHQTRPPPASRNLQVYNRLGEYLDPKSTQLREQSSTHNSNHPPVLYGHVHMAKTGGTSLNGIIANKFDNVCGHKGYSFDAYNDNEKAKASNGPVVLSGGNLWSRSRVKPSVMEDIGYENCDYVSHELNWSFWTDHFGNGKFHGVKMELHVPCRNRIEHLMSMCNYEEPGGKFTKSKIACDAQTDEELFNSVKKCFLYLDRYGHAMLKQFDVKCFSFHNQFSNYVDHMSTILSHRRFESSPYVKRETNDVRNKDDECIWSNPEVMEKVDKFLLDTVPYYQFCDSCMGSEQEIM
ncbi:hypothetical protein ACHAWT_000080 [Skeletonema menzelii]|mmetsp:Transcript_15907/g.26106  ORF Transcript_15907/g.26106 Transcript_15907/m.26106 type:complete len:331 (-) Transcript_15907:1601-2593(-)|eukprot:scaffold6332_cov134-Skeletonema_menzelii.AAC.1